MGTLNTVSITWDEHDRPLITVQYKEAEDSPPAISTDDWLTALGDRLTDKSVKYLRALIDLNESKEHVSLAELAVELGAEKKEADGWNRNLGRSIKAVVRDHGFLRPEQEDGTAQLFDFQWDDKHNAWLYAVPTKFRPTLIKALDQQ